MLLLVFDRILFQEEPLCLHFAWFFLVKTALVDTFRGFTMAIEVYFQPATFCLCHTMARIWTSIKDAPRGTLMKVVRRCTSISKF